MAITGNPGDLATGGFGTGVRGLAATPRDVANAVSRGEAMASARMGGGGQGNNRAGPLAVYGNEFTFTDEELKNAALSNAGLLFGTPQNPTVKMLMDIKKQTDASPKLQGVLNAIQAPFKAGYQAPSGLLDSAVSTAMAPSGSFQGFGLPDVDLNNPLASGMLATQNNEFYSSLPSIAPMMGVAPTDKLAGYMGNQTLTYGPRVGTVPSQTVGTYSGPKGVSSLNPAARMASVQSQGLNIPQVDYTPDELDAATRMVLAESSNIVNPQGGLNTMAAQAVADVIRNRVLSEQFPSTVQGVLSQPRQFEPYGSGAYLSSQYGTENPNYNAVQDVVRAVLSGEAAPVVGGAVNFGNNAIIQNRPTSSTRTQNAFAQMGADPNSVTFYSARNPASVQQTFGVLPGAIPVDFGSPVQVAARQPVPVSDLARAVMPQESARVAFNQPLAPRTPTPNFIDRLATSVFGVPGYDTGPGLLGGAVKSAEMGQQILAGSQPQVVNAVSAPEAPPAVRPTGAPTRLASLLFDRALERARERGGEGRRDRRRKKPSTTTEQTMSDTIEGLLA